MELAELLIKIKSQWLRFFLVSVVMAFCFWLVGQWLPVTYTASISTLIQKVPETTKQGEYTFDGFYVQQAAEDYADTVVGLLESSELLVSALGQIKPGEDVAVIEYRNSVIVEKIAPRLVNISVTRESSDEASQLVVALAGKGSEKVSELNQQYDQNFALEQVFQQPLITQNRVPVNVLAAGGFFLGLVVMVGVVFFEEYLKYYQRSQ